MFRITDTLYIFAGIIPKRNTKQKWLQLCHEENVDDDHKSIYYRTINPKTTKWIVITKIAKESLSTSKEQKKKDFSKILCDKNLIFLTK